MSKKKKKIDPAIGAGDAASEETPVVPGIPEEEAPNAGESAPEAAPEAPVEAEAAPEADQALDMPSWADHAVWDRLSGQQKHKLVNGEDWR